ncbi:hypothetical protein WJX73_004486 [Symbiochloris irregularis]|uniref:Chloride channel protein n=1 Tax=Symbiochloris irregularis TaxID=706552 RepID=A0AAW1PDR5_9CHLO
MTREANLLTAPTVPLLASDANASVGGGGGPELEGGRTTYDYTAFAAQPDESTSYASDAEEQIARRWNRSWIDVLRRFIGGGYDVESAAAHHHYTREERQRLNNHESIDYLPPNSAVFRSWLARQPHKRQWDRWFMMGSIGVSVGLIGYLLFLCINILAEGKYYVVRWLLQHTNAGVAWLFDMAYSVTLVFVSSWTVVTLAPQASGAGVAEVMAYLNGCLIPKVFNVRTLGVKFISCALAVGSGLPVGPEGPMVHIGAMVAAALSQGHSTTMGFSTGLFKRFQNPKDKRDFVTAGTAVGIATAFGAPIGGLLFAFEENTLLRGDTYFGLFDGSASTIVFEVQTQLANHMAAMAPAVVIGVICGLLAIVFTVINLKVARMRRVILKGRKRWRMAEPCILMALFVTLGMFLPLAFPCVPTSCFIQQGQAQPVCPAGTTDVQRVVESDLELYTCRQGIPQADLPAHVGNGTIPTSYNELATLLTVTGEKTIRHLLSRGTHREFGYASLIVMLLVYFAGAVWASGSAIASGLFVPMLVIGSCIGRIVGIAAVDIAASHGFGSPGAPAGVFMAPSPWAWVDPGAFALIGAGAFMGGVTRLTTSLAVIMMEVSNDVRMLLPLLIGILVAKWVADAATHSLYHALLEVACVPFLPPAPTTSVSMDLLPVSAIMASPVVALPKEVSLGELRDVLRDSRHHGFPVVQPTPNGMVLVGIVVREQLMVLLRRALVPGGVEALHDDVIPYEELNRQVVTAAARSLVSEQQLAVLQGRDAAGLQAGNAQAFEGVVDLGPYTNTSACCVGEAFSIERAHMLFKALGLRHLAVVDASQHVKGIITRKDLLGYKLEDAAAKALAAGAVSPDSFTQPHFRGLQRESTNSGSARGRGLHGSQSLDAVF